ncbi:hypothetical protein [Microbacterium sp. NPDC096154]|uniref:hypothetical protein n=1 Tax=Microbacterium sp. NPDC096154 TaxID=3155549 RepID=UPI0033176FFD
MLPRRRLRRSPLITALVVVLTLVGGGGAAAFWSAQARLDGTANAATVGVTQKLLPEGQKSPLAMTYSGTALQAAGAVSIVNRGSRAASYTATVAADATKTSAALRSGIRVWVEPVSHVSACTPQSPPADAVTLDNRVTAVGQIGASSTTQTESQVILCVRTAISPGTLISEGGQRAELTVQSQLTYAPGEDWTVTTEAAALTQDVAALSHMRCEEPLLSASARLTFSQASGATYRVFVAPAGAPDAREQVQNPSIQSGRLTLRHANFPSPNGNFWVTVERVDAGGTSIVGVAEVRTGWFLVSYVSCGWD